MKIRLYYKETDKPIFDRWMQHHGLIGVIPDSALPSIGYVAPDKAMIFVYQTDSDIVALEWLVTNPSLSRKNRVKVAKELIDITLANIKNDFKTAKRIIFVTKHPFLKKELEKVGFVDLQETSFYKVI